MPKLDHIRKLIKLNVEDFKANYKRKYDEKYKARPTQLKVGDYVYIEQKRLKIGDSAHLTPNFICSFMISEKVGRASFKVKHCDKMKDSPSPGHAERMKVAPFGSLERFRTVEPIFGSDASEPSEAVKEKPKVTEYRHRGTTDQTVTETADVESEDSRDRKVTPVDVATQTTNSQSHDVGTETLNVRDDKGIADSLGPVERLLKTRIIRGQRFYWVKWAIAGKASEWVEEMDIPEIMINNFHKRYTLTGRKRRTNTRWKGLV